MAPRMPGLECVHWELCDNQKRDAALRMMGLVLDSPPRAYELEVEYMVDDRGGGGTAELVFERHPVFHPDEEVVQIWREAAEEHVGAGLVVVVRDSRAW